MGSMNEIHIVVLQYIRHVVTMLCHVSLHKSSPVASWDSKVSIDCTLQNLNGSSLSPG